MRISESSRRFSQKLRSSLSSRWEVGKLRGEIFEVIGYMRRAMLSKSDYEWSEYLPSILKGFRWLSEYNGHWNYIKTTTIFPNVRVEALQLFGIEPCTFRQPKPSRYVLGEFCWRVSKARL
jgi:hypothetical protein